MKKTISFSNVKFDELLKIVNIVNIPQIEREKFSEWKNYNYSISLEEVAFFECLIMENLADFQSFTEDELKMKFIGPLLNKIHFRSNTVKDWYQRPLKTKIKGVEIGGITDFMLATGVKEPQKPYFFIQEFKRTKSETDAEDQLIAEMLVAIEKNKNNSMRGAYIVGKIWTFLILEKINNGDYNYYISEGYDCTIIDELKLIYIMLQSIKNDYCKD
jgi:hypothetical protein